MQRVGYIFELVNKCETFEELASAIEYIADGDVNIQGRTQSFNAKRMADQCRNYRNLLVNVAGNPSFLTREFGIRQQAMYIDYYSD